MATKVFIDQDLCTGDGICAEIEPALFEMHDDGLAYVKEADWPTRFGPDGSPVGEPALQMAHGNATVPDKLLATCVEAAEECPGDCIFIDLDD